MSSIKILSSWHNDYYDARILHVASTDPERVLRNDLFWYSTSNMPLWHVGDEVPEDEFIKYKVYKMSTFTSWEDIPDDVTRDM